MQSISVSTVRLPSIALRASPARRLYVPILCAFRKTLLVSTISLGGENSAESFIKRKILSTSRGGVFLSIILARRFFSSSSRCNNKGPPPLVPPPAAGTPVGCAVTASASSPFNIICNRSSKLVFPTVGKPLSPAKAKANCSVNENPKPLNNFSPANLLSFNSSVNPLPKSPYFRAAISISSRPVKAVTTAESEAICRPNCSDPKCRPNTFANSGLYPVLVFKPIQLIFCVKLIIFRHLRNPPRPVPDPILRKLPLRLLPMLFPPDPIPPALTRQEPF